MLLLQDGIPGTPTPNSLPTSVHTYNRIMPFLRVQKTTSSQLTQRPLGKEICWYRGSRGETGEEEQEAGREEPGETCSA